VTDGERSEDGSAGGRRRRGLVVAAGVAVLAALVAVLALTIGGDDDRAPAAAASPAAGSSTAPPSSAAPIASTPTPGSSPPADATPYPPVSAAEAGDRLAVAQADLARLAARLTEPVVLTSPTAWDQWLPGMKPYPGAGTADDIATCPVLSAGLTAALGHRMSYWVGTLPMGPVGCTYAPVPLQYDTIDYPFTVSVGFLGDGTTAAEEAGSAVTVLNGDQPRSCPRTDLPGGGVLAECWSAAGTSLELAVPDARGAGLWVVSGDADDGGDVTAEDAFLALHDGLTSVYG
jgi:hypothetical protein